MGASGWDPSLLDLTASSSDPSWELARQLRFLLDREGLTPRQLAAEHDVPYTPAMLYRFFTGQALPPPQLIEVVARRCGGDLEKLQIAYDAARRRTAMAAVTESLGRGRSQRDSPGRERPQRPDPVRVATTGAAGRIESPRRTGSLSRGEPETGNPSSGERGAGSPSSGRYGVERLGIETPPRPGPARRRSRLGARPLLVAAGVVVFLAAGTAVGAVGVKYSERERSAAGGTSKRRTAPAVPGTQGPVPREPKPSIRIPEPTESNRSEKKARPERDKPRAPQPPAAAPARPKPGGLIANGDFTGTVAPWTATPGLGLSAAGNQMAVTVPPSAVGTVSSNSFPLEAGRGYVLRFEAAASVAAIAVVFVQYQQPAQRSVFATRIPLSPTARPFSFPFNAMPPGSPASIVTFQVRGAEAAPYTVTIDNVSLTPT
jgi:hypothetical protein